MSVYSSSAAMTAEPQSSALSPTSAPLAAGGGIANGQVGIGVVVGLATPLLLIIVACIFLLIRMRNRRRELGVKETFWKRRSMGIRELSIKQIGQQRDRDVGVGTKVWI